MGQVKKSKSRRWLPVDKTFFAYATVIVSLVLYSVYNHVRVDEIVGRTLTNIIIYFFICFLPLWGILAVIERDRRLRRKMFRQAHQQETKSPPPVQ